MVQSSYIDTYSAHIHIFLCKLDDLFERLSPEKKSFFFLTFIHFHVDAEVNCNLMANSCNNLLYYEQLL